MKESAQPLVVLYGYRGKGNKTYFIGRKGLIAINGKMEEIQKILRLCNGLNSLREIIDLLSPIDADTVTGIISIIEKMGIVRDSRELYVGFHEDSSNPPIFSYDIGLNDLNHFVKTDRVRKRKGNLVKLGGLVESNILKTIRNRRSVRQFITGNISSDQLLGLLQATYSRGESGHWSVGSGGGLYPLDLYMIIPHAQQFISRGIFRWHPEENNLSIISDKDPNVWLEKVFNAKTLLENVFCILCVAANLKRSALKYAILVIGLRCLKPVIQFKTHPCFV